MGVRAVTTSRGWGGRFILVVTNENLVVKDQRKKRKTVSVNDPAKSYPTGWVR